MDSDTAIRAFLTIRQQEAKGRAKYGTDLDTAGLSARQVLQHATEEAADLLLYLCDFARRLDDMDAISIEAQSLLLARVADLEAQLQSKSERHVAATVEYERLMMALETENDALRRALAAHPLAPCVYCGEADMSRCPRGFPGCARADDLLAGLEPTR